jgi:hypothetical protein
MKGRLSFDLNKLDYDKDGIPIMRRIAFDIPRSYRKAFIQMMVDDDRQTPKEMLHIIFVRYMRTRGGGATTGSSSEGQKKIPSYRDLPSAESSEQAAKHSANPKAS